MTILRTAVAAPLVAAVLSGCAGLGADQPFDDPTSVAEPTLTPAALARETGLVAPAQVFGGSCAQLFTDSELSDILGMLGPQVDRLDKRVSVCRAARGRSAAGGTQTTE